MIRGLYTSAAGMLAAQSQSEIIGDNIANISTPGFKQEEGSERAFPTLLLDRITGGEASERTPIGTIGTGVVVDRSMMLNVPGILDTTGNATDLALVSGDPNEAVFFSVQTPNGVMYTQNGRFQLSPEGQLQTMDGYAVLGQNGPIGPLDANFTVTPEGTVLDGEGEEVDRLALVQLPGNDVVREGNSLYSSDQAVAAGNVQVKQGAYEASNVDLTDQITNMMTVMRAYEANQRVIQTEDSTLDKAVNEIGRI